MENETITFTSNLSLPIYFFKPFKQTFYGIHQRIQGIRYERQPC